MRFCISGASGFLGSALTGHLTANGHQVVRLVRREPRAADESEWNPQAGVIDDAVLEECDVVVNLAGASFVRWPWTAAYKQQMKQSRIDCTRTIAEAIARSRRRPALLSGSGINRYGDDRGDELLDESSGPGSGFLAEVIAEWEAATQPAVEAGARVCLLRTSAALHRSGGPLRPMLPFFRLGIAGRVGSGNQYFSVLSRTDWLRAVEFLALRDDAEGPYNLASPDPRTNGEFTAELATQLRRPAVVRAPAFAVNATVGELGSLLLGSLRILPTRILHTGFEFQQPELAPIIREALRP